MRPILIVIACLLVSPAAGAEALERIESQVFQTSGTHQDITKHASLCIAQLVRPGFVTVPVIVASDAEAGILIANNEFTYGAVPLFPTTLRARTTLTFSAKDGQFKLVHSHIEEYNEQHSATAKAWDRLTTDRDAAKKTIDALSLKIAQCVQQPNESW